MYEQIEDYVICPHCGKKYRRIIMESLDEKRKNISKEICPFCGEVIRESTEFNYYTWTR